MHLKTKLSAISGVGPKTAAKLERLGLVTVSDLLYYFPRRYEDYTQITKIGDLSRDEGQGKSNESKNFYTIKGTLLAVANKKTRRRGFTVTEAQVIDGTGSIKVVWFNQSFLEKMLKVGNELTLYGKVVFDQYSNGLVMESPIRVGRQKIAPIYGETEGISSFFLAKLFTSVKPVIDEIEEWMPQELSISNYQFSINFQLKNSQLPIQILPIREAILNIHEPRSLDLLEASKKRLAFDELFLIALRSELAKKNRQHELAQSVKVDFERIKKFIKKLPFELTDDQKKAVWAIVKDIEKNVPMNRLLNGDVGSGKTIVAAIIADQVVASGQKVVIMVPTSILASQHYATFCQLFQNDKKVAIGLLTSERQEQNTEYRIQNTVDKKLNYESLILNSDILIGTHALIQPGVEIENVGLVVVDEQHRFGVKQREALQKLNHESGIMNNEMKNHDSKFIIQNSEKVMPHFLSMTATPIPRTLQLALFGDLDFSIIRQKPHNRKEIQTRFVEAYNRGKAYEFIRKLIRSGRQAFVICPLIENKLQSARDSEFQSELFEDERKTVKDEVERLNQIFPEFKIATLHGRMKASEKDEIMTKFSIAKIDILISTSVVEVGIDVPNAVVMIVEDAERFGLAQIHQFRGRVGRGEHQSFCFLFSNTNSEKALHRLKSLEKITDGFKLAEVDLEMRGPGAIFGTEQSGLLDLKMASISDTILIEQASALAKQVTPNLDKYPKLIEKLNHKAQILN